MIKDNVIYFGYGDIGLSTYLDTIYIAQLNEKIEIGEYSQQQTNFKLDISIKIDMKNYQYIKENLDLVRKKEIFSFKVNDYIFNFEHFNSKSIDSVENKLEKAINNYLSCFIC